MKTFIALFFVVALPAAAQKVEVPHKLDFAGITLVIRDDARREIQKDVDALTASPRHYQIKAERARIYFPIIEQIFREEGLPDDFKYLVLQESALIPDAVSTSNAVGFWQFKDFTALEMGLRVDRDIDERLNIAASSRAAARYIIKNNQFFDNWLYALQSYQMGAGGVMKSVKDTEARATRMEITARTYWYVKKFLAHKIAYEGGVKGKPRQPVVVYEHNGRGSLEKLARETMVEEEALRELNKWTKSGAIPDDRTYVVLLPVQGASPALAASTPVVADDATSESRIAPKVSSARARGKINGVNTVRALPGDDVRSLAAHAGVDVPKFLKWNDMENGDVIVAGQEYFLSGKRLKGAEAFHKLSEGETLWTVSQRYGLKLHRLKRYNRIADAMEPAPGTMLYLASKRPRTDAVMEKVKDPVEVDQQKTFSWTVTAAPSDEETVAGLPAQGGAVQPAEKPSFEAPVKAADSLEILQTSETTRTLGSTPAEAHLPLPDDKRHTVKAGETLYGIARLYNVSVMELVAANDLSLQEGIRPGQILRLSSDEPVDSSGAVASHGPVSVAEFFHEVKPSDTLYSIARQYNVTIQQIMEWNEKKDFSLAVGEKLKILRGQ